MAEGGGVGANIKIGSPTMTQTMWEFFDTNSLPSRQQCVAEWKQWLGEVKNSSERRRLESELKGVDKTHHRSASLELFFHQYFAAEGWYIQWHPSLPHTSHKPDFHLEKNSQAILVEALISEQKTEFAQQEEFSERLKAELEQIELPYRVEFDATIPVPPAYSFDVIKERIKEYMISEIKKGPQETDTGFRHYTLIFQATRYDILFDLYFDPVISSSHLVAKYTLGGMSGMADKLHENIAEKAIRYGLPGEPFVIAVWGRDYPTITDEIWALYGRAGARITRDESGNSAGPAESIFHSDGVFLIEENGQLKHRQASAVVFYQHRLEENDHQHKLRVYHNPFALYPLNQSVFSDYPQFIPVMGWIPKEPED